MEVAQKLIEAKIDLNLQDSHGCTALHFAVEKGQAKLAQVLLRARADLNLQNFTWLHGFAFNCGERSS